MIPKATDDEMVSPENGFERISVHAIAHVASEIGFQ
jgi:hypothetical protein